MEQTMPVGGAGEAFIELLNANDVDYIFLNPGSDTYAIQEAVCKFKELGKRTPDIILCLHESVAMAAAHGHFNVTGKPQVVFVHADLGPQQVGGALHNAQRGRAGIVLCSGRVPSNIDKSRLNQVHWLQEQADQAGVVRNYVKWNYELRTNDNIHHVVQRAFQMASSEPCGPVYLCMPTDLLAEKMKGVPVLPVTRHSAPVASGIDGALLGKIASLLTRAKRPLIITGYSGRHTDSVAALVELAETLGARVISDQIKMNFPTNHPLLGGFLAGPYIKDADLVIIIDNDVPYIPAQAKPRPDARIIQIDIDPLKQNYPLWGFPVDILVQADSSKVLPALVQAVKEKASAKQRVRFQARSRQIQGEHEKMRDEWRNLALAGATKRPITPDWLCHCVDEILDEDAILVAEPVTNLAVLLRQIHRTKPGTYFLSGGSNLGWGLGAALGTKLASPDKTVVTMVGDGSFVFGCPTAAFWAATNFHAPFLCIILNNMQYTAPKLTIRRSLGPESYTMKTGKWIGTDIRPCPDYAAIARGCHAYGKSIDEPSELPKAIKTALDQVRAGKPAVLDVRVEGLC